MKKTLKLFVVFGLSFVLAWGVAAFCVKRMNAEGYRPQLTKMLGDKMGVQVKLDGPIAFTFGLKGLRISVEDVAFASLKPSDLAFSARIGRVELGMGLRSFWRGYFLIDAVSLENADILLKADLKIHPAKLPSAPAADALDFPSLPVDSEPFSLARLPLRIDNLIVINSQVAVVDADEKRSSINVSFLSWKRGVRRAEFFLRGSVEDSPVELDIKASLDDPEGQKPFFVYTTGLYGDVRLAAQARVNLVGGLAEVSTYDLSARDSRMSGDLAVAWGQGKPVIRGTVNSAYLNWKDFIQGFSVKEENAGDKGQASVPSNPAQDDRVFSYAQLPLDRLKQADADLSIFVRTFPVGIGAFEDVTAKLVLSDGNFALDPVKARIGAAPSEARILLDASKPSARLDIGFIAKDVDLGDLQKIFGMQAFMTGKAEANIRLGGEGESAYDIASSLNGIANVTAFNGTILNGAVSKISSMLATVFAPGQGDSNALNCLAVRFIVKDGVANDNGILIDSVASTIFGAGQVDLGSEAVQMMLLAQPKLSPVNGLVAPLKVEGTLASPSFSFNTANIVKNVVGALLKDRAAAGTLRVPAIQADPEGGNACVYTLEHPQKDLSPQPLSPSTGVTKAGERIKDFGRSLVNDLFGQ